MDDELKIDVAVLKNQQSALVTTLASVEVRQQGISTSVTKLETGHLAIIEGQDRIETQLKELSAKFDKMGDMVVRHEQEIDTLEGGVKWGGGIMAALITAMLGKMFGLH